ncbi:MAG TPA: hypothetical protein VKD28_18640, partial [Gemmatimonadales bacterium]|nr:hypothetical protein [Gemmatimonadales bacterium]
MNQDPRGTELEGHLSPEELAVLAERGRDGASREALEHLARCRSCMSAYADVVRYRAGLLAFPDAFEGDEDRAGRDPNGGRVDPRVGTSNRARPRAAAWRAAAAMVIVVSAVAIVWWIRQPRPPRDGDPIIAMLESASADGLVIPGGEAGAAGAPSVYRAPQVESEAGDAALERLRRAYESAPPAERDGRRLVAALVAAGQVELARVYASEGLVREPNDVQLLTLAGIVAYRSGDLAQAERRLRAALQSSPGD